MEDLDYICPVPKKWHEIHQVLQYHWETKLHGTGVKPPVPLILAGWNFSEDWQKKERWIETISWAKYMGLDHLIPNLSPDEKYFG
jgi:hypothetical protein